MAVFFVRFVTYFILAKKAVLILFIHLENNKDKYDVKDFIRKGLP